MNDEVEAFYKMQEDIKKEFDGFSFDVDTAGLDDLGKSLYTIKDIFTDLQKETNAYNKALTLYAGNEDELSKIRAKHTENQISGYGQMAGAVSEMFDQGSKASEAFKLVQSTLAVTNGVNAIITAWGSAPFPYNIPAVTITTAQVGALLGSIGESISTLSSGGSISYDAFSSMSENTGTGSVLGDKDAQSESITNSLGILEDFAEPQYAVLTQMNKYLASIDGKIGGISSIIYQNAGFALGEDFTATSNQNLSINSTLANFIATGATGAILGELKIPVISDIVNFLGDGINSILGGLFGKTSTSLADAGIYFADQLLTSAIEEIMGSSYQTVAIKTKSWFSSSTSVVSYFDALDEETGRQFTLVLDSLYQTVLLAGEALDTSALDIENSLSDFVVSIGKISLLNKTADEIQEQLSAIFSTIGDDIAEDAFPLLTNFQQVGEGLFETLTRVATGMSESEYYLSRLGDTFEKIAYSDILNTQGDIGFEALLQSITAVEEVLYPVNNNLLTMVENLDATAEELYTVYVSLDELRDRLLFLGQNYQGISSSMIYGAGSISDLESGFESYFENFLTSAEQLAYETSKLVSEFDKLSISIPSSKNEFTELIDSIDLTSESGQELYGRLIILAESFSDVMESTTDNFNTFIDSLDSIGNSVSNMKDTALSFLNSNSDSSLESQIISYNKLRSEFSSYFDTDGTLKGGVDVSTVSSLYSEISSMASSLISQDDSLKDTLVTQFNSDILDFDLTNDVIKVNIVDGLSSLLSLSATQAMLLQTVANDGLLTNNELSSLGITDSQKSMIISIANNTDYLTTESGYESLEDYISYLSSNLNSFAVGTTNVAYDQIAQIHKGEGIVPENFMDGVRKGEVMMGNTQTLEEQLGNLITITTKQANQIRSMRKEIKEMNERSVS